MQLGADSRIGRYTGDIHSLLYNSVGKICKADGHDDPRSPQVGLWVFRPQQDDMEPVLIRRRDWIDAIH